MHPSEWKALASELKESTKRQKAVDCGEVRQPLSPSPEPLTLSPHPESTKRQKAVDCGEVHLVRCVAKHVHVAVHVRVRVLTRRAGEGGRCTSCSTW